MKFQFLEVQQLQLLGIMNLFITKLLSIKNIPVELMSSTLNKTTILSMMFLNHGNGMHRDL